MSHFTKYMNLTFDEESNRLYYISDENGTHNLWMLKVDSGEKEQLTDSDQNVKDYWLEENALIAALDFNGNEREQFYKLEKDALSPLINDPDYFHHYGVYEKSKEQYYLTRNHHESAGFELCCYSRNNGLTVLKSFDAPVSIIRQLNNAELLMTRDMDNIDKQLVTYNIETGNIYEFPSLKGRFKGFSLQEEEDRAYCIADWDDEFMNLYELNLKTGAPRKLTTFEWDIEHLQLSEDQKSAVITVNENGCSCMHHINMETMRISKLNFREDGVIHSLKRENEDSLFLIYSSVDIPHKIYRFNIEGESEEIILDNMKEAEALNWEMLSYASFDGLEIPYFLYESKSEAPAPTVIHIHGGPESQARPEFNTLYYMLNKHGFNVAVPNIRGSLGYGRFYLESDDRRKRLDAMRDIIGLRTHLIRRRYVDESSISIMGRSYGGFMTLMLITHHPDLWKAAVDIVGISHLKTFLGNTPAWRRHQRSAEYGFLGGDDEFFKEIAPLERSRDITAPLMIFHSHHDSRVPYSESVQMAERMQQDDQDVSFITYEDEGHTFMRSENVEDMNDKITAFLIRHTKMIE